MSLLKTDILRHCVDFVSNGTNTTYTSSRGSHNETNITTDKELKEAYRRRRNKEGAKRRRDQKGAEEAQMKKMYEKNEQRIKVLERQVEDLTSVLEKKKASKK